MSSDSGCHIQPLDPTLTNIKKKKKDMEGQSKRRDTEEGNLSFTAETRKREKDLFDLARRHAKMLSWLPRDTITVKAYVELQALKSHVEMLLNVQQDTGQNGDTAAALELKERIKGIEAGVLNTGAGAINIKAAAKVYTRVLDLEKQLRDHPALKMTLPPHTVQARDAMQRTSLNSSVWRTGKADNIIAYNRSSSMTGGLSDDELYAMLR